jgi:hypothetical protein
MKQGGVVEGKTKLRVSKSVFLQLFLEWWKAKLWHVYVNFHIRFDLACTRMRCFKISFALSQPQFEPEKKSQDNIHLNWNQTHLKRRNK